MLDTQIDTEHKHIEEAESKARWGGFRPGAGRPRGCRTPSVQMIIYLTQAEYDRVNSMSTEERGRKMRTRVSARQLRVLGNTFGSEPRNVRIGIEREGDKSLLNKVRGKERRARILA